MLRTGNHWYEPFYEPFYGSVHIIDHSLKDELRKKIVDDCIFVFVHMYKLLVLSVFV